MKIISLAERWDEITRLWIHASIQLPSRVVQVYVRRELGMPHREIVSPGVTLEALQRLNGLGGRQSLTRAIGALMAELKDKS